MDLKGVRMRPFPLLTSVALNPQGVEAPWGGGGGPKGGSRPRVPKGQYAW